MFLLFNIGNPFKRLIQIFEPAHVYTDKKLSKHKFLELELFVDSQHIFELQIDLRLRGRDHAGPAITLNLLCLAVSARIYDHRHWDYKNNCWEDSYTDSL